MLRFEFKYESLTADDGSVIARAVGDYAFHDVDEDHEGILAIENGRLTIDEEYIKYTPIYFVCSLKLKIEECNGYIPIFKGEAIPIEVGVELTSDGNFIIKGKILINGDWREVDSVERIELQEWFELKIVLLDGCLICFINDQPALRRVYTGEARRIDIGWGRSELVICEISDGSKILIDDIEFGGELNNEIKGGLKLEEIGYMEIECKYFDLIAAGINVGHCLAEKTEIVKNTSVYYNRYENGAIVWSSAHRAVWITRPIFEKYQNCVNTSLIGLPVLDDREAYEYNGTFCIFEGAIIINNREQSEVVVLSNKVLTEYQKAGLDHSGWGYPYGEMEEISLGEERVYCQFFSHNVLVISEFKDKSTATNVIDHYLADLYLSNIKEYGLLKQATPGFNGKIVNEEGNEGEYEVVYLECDKKIECSIVGTVNNSEEICYVSSHMPVPKEIYQYFVQHDGINAEKDYGKYKLPLDQACYETDGTVYMNFFGGVIVKYPDLRDVQGFNEIKIVLSDVIARKIKDPIGQTPELYITVSIDVNGTEIEKNRRWPDYSERRHGGSSFAIIYEGKSVDEEHPEGTNVYYRISNLRGERSINLIVEAYDYDRYTKNDFIGKFDFTFDITNGWGLLKNALGESNCLSYIQSISNNKAVYEGAYLTSQGKDNRDGLKNVRLSFRIERLGEKVDLSEKFRKYGYWTINNYGTTQPLSRSLYDSVFNVATSRMVDRVFNPFDEAWYDLAKRKGSGKGGQCFGLSLEAMNAVKGASPYSVPLDDWNLYADKRKEPSYISKDTDVDSGFAQRIRGKHLYQIGWDFIAYTITVAIGGVVLVASNSFRNIKYYIQNDGCCLVNLFGGGAHTVLAYKYDDDRIFVADANEPWWFDSKDDKGGDESFIELTGKAVKQVELNSNSIKTYNTCYGAPYWLVKSQPRTPILADFIGMLEIVLLSLHSFSIINFVSWVGYLIIGDIKATFTDYPREGAIEAATIPMYSDSRTTSTYSESGVTFIFTAQCDTLSIVIEGDPNSEYVCHVFSRERFITVSNKLGPSGKDIIRCNRVENPKHFISVYSVPIRIEGEGSVAPIEQVPIESPSVSIISRPTIKKFGRSAASDDYIFGEAEADE